MKKLSIRRISRLGAGLISLQLITGSAFAQTASYQIIDRWKNAYLCDTGANATYHSTSTGTHCQWIMIDVAGGFKSFRNLATNDYLHNENLTGKLQAAGGDASWWSANWALETIDKNYVWIRNRWQSAHYLHVENQTGFAQHGVIDKNWWSSQWKLQIVNGPSSSSSSSSTSRSITSSSSSSSISSSSVSSSSSSVSTSSSVSSSSSSITSSSSSSLGTSATYQAEDNFYSGGVSKASLWLENFNSVGARVIFSANVNSAGTFPVNLQYGNGSGTAKTLNIYVNGLLAKTTTLQPTGGNTSWANQSEQLALRAGLNTITYQYDSGNSGGVNIDLISVANASPLAARGATVSYQEYEAEAGSTNGQVSAYGTTFPSIESESSGRKYVSLSGTGQYVQWTAAKAANSLVVRYNLPESANGGGTPGTLSLYVNNNKVQTLSLTSRFQYTYGGYPFNNDNPSAGTGHHFYDEAQITGLNIPAGATVKLQRDGGDNAAFYKIDLINLEQIDSTYPMPANFVSITTQGAAANDGNDDTQAIINTINYAQQTGQGVWIPAGTFNINARLENISNIHIRGAGMWHTRLAGSNGQGGFIATGSNVTIADMMLTSDSYYRDNAAHKPGIEGNFGTGSLIQNVWVEHMKVGFWINEGTDGLFITNSRIRDTWADGVNLHGGVKNTTVSQLSVRNTGDDNVAMWSPEQPAGKININNTFRYITAQVPVLANNFAIYGGQDNKLLDSIGSDTVRASAGITISTRSDFPGGTAEFTGTTEIKRNTLNRTGGWEPNWNTSFGGLWIYADTKNMNHPIIVDTLAINNSTYEGILVSYGYNVANLTLSNVQVNGAGTFGINFNNVTGTGYFSNVTVTGAASGALNNPANRFTIIRGTGNSGW